MQDRRHRSLLNFIRKLIEVPAGFSKEDLQTFKSIAAVDYPSLVRVIDEYLAVAARADSDVVLPGLRSRPTADRNPVPDQPHLFDLLRDRRLFPSNAGLSQFAARIMPDLQRARFNKMSRGDIAARIVEYLETRDLRTREKLENSMRDVIQSEPGESQDHDSFLTKWERIIKGTEL